MYPFRKARQYKGRKIAQIIFSFFILILIRIVVL
jgi:hypothetical protein